MCRNLGSAFVGVHRSLAPVYYIVVDPVLHKRSLVGCSEDALIIRFVLGKEQLYIPLAVEMVRTQNLMLSFDRGDTLRVGDLLYVRSSGWPGNPLRPVVSEP